MLTISQQQYRTLEDDAEARYRASLQLELRRELGAYVDDLTDAELANFVATMLGEARALGFTTADEIAAFARPCVVYGALSHRDPLFEALFYAPLPGFGARRRLTAEGISRATALVLGMEFAARGGAQLIVDLARVFLNADHPVLAPGEALAAHFPERAARLPPGTLEAHRRVAGREADRLGLKDPAARRVHGDVALLLGACFGRDPLYPWAVAAFATRGDRRRILRLRAAMMLIADRAAARL